MSSLSVFGGLLVLSFGATVLFSGLFTAYFGAGKSRKIGLGLTLTGLVVLAFFLSSTWDVSGGLTYTLWAPEEIVFGIAAVLGAAVGALVGAGAFLFSIMKA